MGCVGYSLNQVIGDGDAASVKLGGTATVRESGIVALSVPEVPVIVRL